MARFHLSKAATRDLQQIIGYIRQRSTTAAKRVKAELRSEMIKLVSMPHMGHKREDATATHLRFWSLYSYLIVYNPDSKPLEIVRILHGARDLHHFFNE
jgi:plasmid stabilization system protein ParE